MQRLVGVDGRVVVGQVERVGFEGAAGDAGGGRAADPAGFVGLFFAVGVHLVDLAAFGFREEGLPFLFRGELVEVFDVVEGLGHGRAVQLAVDLEGK